MTAEATPGIGRRFERPDARAKASGRATYLSDLRLDGMLDAAVVRSPLPRARVTAIDASEALALDGVVAVLAPDDARHLPRVRALPDSPPIGRVLTDEPMFVGDAVAAVVARDRAVARAAADLVFVDYDELAPVLDAEEPEPPLLYEQAPGNLAGPPAAYERGDVDAAFARAARVFEDVYRTQRQCAQTIEPMGCVCRWPATGGVEVWTHLDNLFHLREQLAEILALDEAEVRVRAPEALGATFGLKNGVLTSLEPLAALLSRAAGAPVRLLLSPEESIACTVTRHPATIRLRTAVDADGALIAREADVLLDSGAHGFGYAVVRSMLSKWAMLYDTPNLRFAGRAVYTNQPPCGAYRGVGTAQIHFALESQIDDVARALGEDPVAYRLRHAVRAGRKLPGGTPIRALGVRAVAERGADAIGWDAPRERGDDRVARGLGMALGMHHSGVTNLVPGIVEQSSCRARVAADGGVALAIAAVDKGQGARSSLTAIAADALGLPPAAVRFDALDSGALPYDAMGAEASRTTFVVGRAVADACAGLRAEIARRVDEPEDRLDLAALDLAGLAAAGELAAEATFAPSDGDPLPVIGAAFAEVEVDRLTGRTRVLRLVAAQDVGRAIDVLGCEGQIEGGVHHGIGYALVEEMVLADGQPLNGDFAGYRVLMANDMPRITPILVEEPDAGGGPFGAKGLGTGVIPAIAPAVCNAIRDATGARPLELPVNPERLVELLAANDRHTRGAA